MSEINLSKREPGEVRPPQKSSEKKISIKDKLKSFFKNPKKRLVFICICGALAIIFFGLGLYILTSDRGVNKPIRSESVEKNKETVELFSAPLDGVMVDKASSERHPLAIVIENLVEARPQSGLNKASIVYEAVVEGGVTRFLAIFGTNEAEKIGPVRSVRTFFVDWAHGFDAYLAHVGGNIDALDKIPHDKILDLDQFQYSNPYWRERSANLASEHTMYTSTAKLRQQAAANGYSSANNFNITKFKEDQNQASLPEFQKISIDFSGNNSYKVIFDYDKTSNSYKRSQGGSAHIDKVTQEQISPKNIIVMTVKRKATITRINEPGWEMTTTGSGAIQVYLDGKTITGTWKKESAGDRELFYDENGKEIEFNRGQFWICVVPPEVKPQVN